MNSCIKDLNKDIPKSKQIPSELIVAQAAIETLLGVRFSRISDEAKLLYERKYVLHNPTHMIGYWNDSHNTKYLILTMATLLLTQLLRTHVWPGCGRRSSWYETYFIILLCSNIQTWR